MVRKLVIAVLPAALAVGHAGAASAWVIVNGGSENGTQLNGGGSNGGGPNGIHINGIKPNGQGTQGVSANGAAGAMVISIELPAPVVR